MSEATAAGGDTPAQGGTAQAGQDGGQAATKWWDSDRFNDGQRTILTAKGLTVDDPLDALPKLLDMHRNAESRLGHPADRLVVKPKEGEDLAAWLRTNGLAALPEKPEGYEVKQPEAWPKDVPWDKGLEEQARTIAHKHGVRGEALSEFVGLYAGAMQGVAAKAEAEVETARTAMMAELERDWGAQTPAKLARAQQAMSVLGERAGFTREQQEMLAGTLKAKVGDAGVIRFFSTLGDMLGDDSAAGIGRGGAALGMTPADARAELHRLRADDGPYAKAAKAGNREELARLKPEIERLSRIAAGG